MTIHTGITLESAQKIADHLLGILDASKQTYSLTQSVHWNITGPLFHSVHVMTEEHYLELAEAVDDIAERVRALDVKVPFHSDQKATLAVDPAFENADANNMISTLVRAHENVATLCRSAIEVAGESDDEVTVGLLTDRLTVHEKTAWMLRSLIQ